MKKSLLVAAAACLFGAANAQITLDSSSVGPVGSIFYTAVDTVLPIGYDLGTPGTAVTWDFSQLNQDYYDTIYYLDPSTTPYFGDFPTADLTIAQTSQGLGFAYFEKSDTNFILLGFAADPLMTGTPIVIAQDPPSVAGIFPWTYQNSLLDTSTITIKMDGTFLGFPGVDSIEYISTTMRDLYCDSWGTLILWGSTNNALRNKEIRQTHDIVNARFFGTWTNFQDTSYTDSSFIWMNDTRGYTMAKADYEGGVLVSIEYQDANPVGVLAEIDAATRVYPNPAQDRVTVENEMGVLKTVRVMSVNGQLIREVKMDGTRAEIQLNGLAPGMYILQGMDAEHANVMQRKLIIR